MKRKKTVVVVGLILGYLSTTTSCKVLRRKLKLRTAEYVQVIPGAPMTLPYMDFSVCFDKRRGAKLSVDSLVLRFGESRANVRFKLIESTTNNNFSSNKYLEGIELFKLTFRLKRSNKKPDQALIYYTLGNKELVILVEDFIELERKIGV